MKRYRYVERIDDAYKFPWNSGAGFDTLAEVRQYALDLEDPEGAEDRTAFDGCWQLVDIQPDDSVVLLQVEYDGSHRGGSFRWLGNARHLSDAKWKSFKHGERPWLALLDAYIKEHGE